MHATAFPTPRTLGSIFSRIPKQSLFHNVPNRSSPLIQHSIVLERHYSAAFLSTSTLQKQPHLDKSLQGIAKQKLFPYEHLSVTRPKSYIHSHTSTTFKSVKTDKLTPNNVAFKTPFSFLKHFFAPIQPKQEPSRLAKSFIAAIRPHYYSDGKYSGRSESFKYRLNRFLNNIPPNLIIYSIIAFNILVYLAWYYAESKAQLFKDFRLLRHLFLNWAISIDNIREGRFWTLITSCFSHESASHLVMNLITFYFFAPPVMSMIGPAAFLGLYFGSGIISTAAFHTWAKYQASKSHGTFQVPKFALGASGAIYGILSCFAVAYPMTQIVVLVFPVPAAVGVGGLLVYDFINTFKQFDKGTASVSHVAGAATGALYCLRLMRRI